MRFANLHRRLRALNQALGPDELPGADWDPTVEERVGIVRAVILRAVLGDWITGQHPLDEVPFPDLEGQAYLTAVAKWFLEPGADGVVRGDSWPDWARGAVVRNLWSREEVHALLERRKNEMGRAE